VIFGLPTTVLLDCITVIDDLYGELGQACVSEGLSKLFSYSIDVGPFNDPGTYLISNTATIVETQASDGAEATVRVSVPEPSIALLLGVGLAGMGFARHKKRNRSF
jgi:hypothetical protein